MVKQASHSDPEHYTKPELRDRIKAEITEGDKGGKPGQWSARKAQMVAHEYEKQGGGYNQAPDEQQKSLKKWGDEHWKTEDGEKADRPGGTTRYLPEKAWESLSKEEKAATNRKKREGSAQGKQFVANTEEATAATKSAKAGKPAKKSAAGSKPSSGVKKAAAPSKTGSTKKASGTSTKSAETKTAAAKSESKAKSPAKKSPAKKASSSSKRS